jgi:hypothetical protein
MRKLGTELRKVTEARSRGFREREREREREIGLGNNPLLIGPSISQYGS